MPDAHTPDTPFTVKHLFLGLVALTLLFLVARVPGYLHYLIGGMAVLFPVLFGYNMLLRHQVAKQTHALTATNHHLKEEIRKRRNIMQEFKKYARVVEASNDAIALFDRYHNHLLVNTAYLSIFGFSRDDLQQLNLPEVVGQEFYQHYLEGAIKRCLTGEQVDITAIFGPAGRPPKHLHIHLGPYVISEDYIQGYVIDIRDSSQQVELTNQLKHAQKMEATGTSPVWSAVEDHQGHIDIDSTPGTGATFTLYIPATRDRTAIER